MAEILIAVADRHRHTGKIAAALTAAGHDVHLCGDLVETDPCATDYDLMIAGATVRNGQQLAPIADWALCRNDHVCTDWNAVKTFAADRALLLASTPAPSHR
jgi:menaquinone-dependent protoporphyrinogen IX oxidase